MILFGPPGSGTTTLGREVAELLGIPHFDIDDFHWRWDTKIPYTTYHSSDKRVELLTNAINKHHHFIMSGSMWSIRHAFEPMFIMAGYVLAPAEIRAERLRARSLARWGDRVQPGGDMYNAHGAYRDYFDTARQYDTDVSPEAYRLQHEQWASLLPCPVLRVDGTLDVGENATMIAAQFRATLALSRNITCTKASKEV